MPGPSSSELSASLSSLSLNTSDTSNPKAKSAPVAESWEDASSDTETDEPTLPAITKPATKVSSNPTAPPPTPASPNAPNSFPDYTSLPASHPLANAGSPSRDQTRDSERRPDKTTSVASRMIAAGLGVRAPKRTEEEREYERVMREKQVKAREEKKREEAEREKAKKSMWED